MDARKTKKLCIALMEADTEEQVIGLLAEAGYWDEPDVWHFYGDRETNFNTIGNQKSRPDAALVEKIINSVDARLINECLTRGVDPEGPKAPQSIREAVAVFFEAGLDPSRPTAGRVSEWAPAKRTEVARGVTLAATGFMPRQGNPCFTISDCGEGQTPGMMPHTLLSLDRSNKLRIPFVQGKFNMGGTGVLQFCGHRNLQLVVSRRNPLISKQNRKDMSDHYWGFSVVRREDPHHGRRSSVYTYLAPVGVDSNPGRGGVLSFPAENLPIFPSGSDPYARETSWGTLIKLYEYAATSYKSHILLKDGLLRRADLLLPEVALPMRFHECRTGYKGHAGSPETTVAGLSVRLSDDKAENLEHGFPSSSPISVRGEHMTATIYAFKKGRGDTYRKTEGIVFTLNGQTHGHLTTDFFRRTGVGLSYLVDSVLVVLDCSKFSGRAREDLFMNSRDRLRAPDLRFEIEDELEDLLKHHDGLRDLRERRRREEIESRLADSRPLEDVLKSVLQRSPTLARLFLTGSRVTNPFKTIGVQEKEKQFEGKRFPSYFKFKGKDYGSHLERDCHINMRCRVTFETDATNDYFSREVDPGEFTLDIVSAEPSVKVSDYSLNLQNGVATLSVRLPRDSQRGDKLTLVATISDRSRIEPFANRFTVTVKGPIEPSGSHGQRRKPPNQEKGVDRETPSGISLPNIMEVPEAQWGQHTPPFDQLTALRIKHAGSVPDEGQEGGIQTDIFDFYVNVDNVYFKSEVKLGGDDVTVKKARFVNGLVLIGLAVLHDDQKQKQINNAQERNAQEGEAANDNVEDRIEKFTRALAPVLLPVIESLGSLDLDTATAGDLSGEAV